MNIDVSRAGAHCTDQFVYLARIQALSSRRKCRRDVRADVGRKNSAGDGSRWRWAWLYSRRAVSLICAEKYRDAAIDSHIAKVDVGLLNSTFQLGIT